MNTDTTPVSTDLPPGWDLCGACRGYGIVERWTGSDVEVADCRTCLGGGLERKRDARGRFSR